MGNVKISLVSFIYAVYSHSCTAAVKATPNPNTCVCVNCAYCRFAAVSLLFHVSGDMDDRGMGVVLHLIVGVSKYRIVRSLFITEQDLRDNGDFTESVLSC